MLVYVQLRYLDGRQCGLTMILASVSDPYPHGSAFVLLLMKLAPKAKKNHIIQGYLTNLKKMLSYRYLFKFQSSKIKKLILNLYTSTYTNTYSIWSRHGSGSGIRIRIRIQFLGCIRIRIKLMRIRNTDLGTTSLSVLQRPIQHCYSCNQYKCQLRKLEAVVSSRRQHRMLT